MPTNENSELRTYYEWSGQDHGEVLLLGNSLGSNLHMWDKVLPGLERSHRILRYDTRGHGKSSVPPAPYTLDQLGRDVLFLLDSLGVRRVDYCGLSLGGMVGMWLGLHAPHRVRRMVLANTAARIGTREMWNERIENIRNSGMGPIADATPARWFTLSYRESHAEEMEAIREMVAATDPVGYSGCCGVLRDTDLRNDLAAIETPSLVITGTEDPATPPADGRALCAGLPDARYVELNASHLSAWERADDFAKEVLAFLENEERCDG